MSNEKKTNTETIMQIKNYFKEKGLSQVVTDSWEEYFGEVHLIVEGDIRVEHEKVKRIMKDLDYSQLFQNVLSIKNDICVAEHVYRK